MNTTPSSALRLAAVAATFAVLNSISFATAPSAADRATSALALTGSVPVQNAGPYVEVGSYLIHVVSHLGKPDTKLPDGTWLYKRFQVQESDTKGILVVRFNRGRVENLSLVTPTVATAMMEPKKAKEGFIVADRK